MQSANEILKMFFKNPIWVLSQILVILNHWEKTVKILTESYRPKDQNLYLQYNVYGKQFFRIMAIAQFEKRLLEQSFALFTGVWIVKYSSQSLWTLMLNLQKILREK
jgi:hypothetical protein